MAVRRTVPPGDPWLDDAAIQLRTLFYREADRTYGVQPHVHQATQYYHCVHGGLEVGIEGRVFHLQPGDGVLVPPGAVRRCRRLRSPLGYLVAIFHDRHLRLGPVCNQVVHLGDDLQVDMRALLAELSAAVAGPDSEILCRALLVRLMIGARRQLTAGAGSADHQAAPVGRLVAGANDDARLVAEVDAVLRRNLHRAPTRAAVAQAVGLSEAHLARRYRQATDATVHQRLSELQVEQAAALLRESTLSIAQIAAEVGFASTSHFGKVFRAAKGCTPSEWRDQD